MVVYFCSFSTFSFQTWDSVVFAVSTKKREKIDRKRKPKKNRNIKWLVVNRVPFAKQTPGVFVGLFFFSCVPKTEKWKNISNLTESEWVSLLKGTAAICRHIAKRSGKGLPPIKGQDITPIMYAFESKAQPLPEWKQNYTLQPEAAEVAQFDKQAVKRLLWKVKHFKASQKPPPWWHE